MSVAHQWPVTGVRVADIHLAQHKLKTGDLDGCVDIISPTIDNALRAGEKIWLGHSITILVEALVQRGTDADLRAAQAAIDRLEAVPVDPGFALHDVQLLRMRALLARAQGDDTAYRAYVERYRARAVECGYSGHIAVAETM